MRALLELFITILAAFVAKALIGSIMKGFANASGNAFQQQPGAPQPPPSQQQAATAGQLHKDPVCGTYVSEASGFQKRLFGQAFYYCSQACKEKHSLVTR